MRSSTKSSVRSRSLDTEESEDKEMEEEKRSPLYKVLASYTAVSPREVVVEHTAAPVSVTSCHIILHHVTP